MYRCQMCQGSNKDPKVFTCGHIHCGKCANKEKIGSKEFRCQWQKGTPEACGKLSDHLKIKTLPKYEDDTDSEEEDKYMDPELVALAKEMGVYKKRKRMAQRIKQGLEKEPIPPTHEIFQATITLSKIARQCDAILGFYENRKGDKVVVDVVAGRQPEANNFIRKHVENTDYNIFHYIEQDGTKTRYLVATGAKVAYEDIYSGPLDQNAHPDLLRDAQHMATVSCLGKGSDDKLYILTAKHIFNRDQAAQPGAPGLISSFRNRLTHVGERCVGYMGTLADQADGDIFIDIAAIELCPAIITELNANYPNLMFDLNPMYRNSPILSYDLKDKTVYKNGAATGTTCGKIVKHARYWNPSNGHRAGGFTFEVESDDPNIPFAEPGDSGALIWIVKEEDERIPIGIVSFQIENALDEDGSPQPPTNTHGVRLNYCIEALKEEKDIEIVKCKVLGSPLPACMHHTPDFSARFANPADDDDNEDEDGAVAMEDN